MATGIYSYSFRTEQRHATSLSVYDVGLEQCLPSHTWGPGIRDYYLLHHVIGGQGTYTVAGRTYRLKAGDSFLAYPDTTISYCADDQNPWEYYWVGFGGADIKLLLNQTDFSPETPVLRTDFGSKLRDALLQIYQSRGSQPYETVRMTSHLYELIACLMEHANRRATTPPGVDTVHRACAYISHHYAKPLTVSHIAQAAGVSRSWLYRMFQKYLGVSPIHYLMQYRLEQARLLLRDASFSVKSVSFSVGFEDPLYFSRVFKKATGLSPRNYMLQNADSTQKEE